MLTAFRQSRGVLLVVSGILLGYAGCSTGTNTGNGTVPSSTGGASGTGGMAGFCLEPDPCDELVDATDTEGETYRGTVRAQIAIASDADAQSVLNPPAAMLWFLGTRIQLTDAGCYSTGSALSVDIYLPAADSSVDDAGALRVHSAGRSDSYASGPRSFGSPPSPGWAVDLTLTPGGQLTALLSVVSQSIDAGAVQTLKLNGLMQPLCIDDPDSTKMVSATMPVRGGGKFAFPCATDWSCGFPPSDQ